MEALSPGASGGDSAAIQHQLQNVRKLYGSKGAFAAILADGSLITWGEPNGGGDSSGVEDQLTSL